MANKTLPAQFLFENLQIQNNLIHGAYQNGVKKLLFLGRSASIPGWRRSPSKRSYFLSGAIKPPQ